MIHLQIFLFPWLPVHLIVTLIYMDIPDMTCLNLNTTIQCRISHHSSILAMWCKPSQERTCEIQKSECEAKKNGALNCALNLTGKIVFTLCISHVCITGTSATTQSVDMQRLFHSGVLYASCPLIVWGIYVLLELYRVITQ